MDEIALIQQCLQGNRKTFEPLVRHYQKSMLAVAAGILRDPDDACDAVQDAFYQAFLNLHRFDTNRNFRKWLISIVIKRCLDRLRRKKTFHRFLLNYQSHQQETESRIKSAANNEENFRFLLTSLKDRERAIVILYFREELSIREIAEIMECSESTTRVHLFNARRKIKKEMNHEMPDH